MVRRLDPALGLLGLAIGCSRSPVLVPTDNTGGDGSSTSASQGDYGEPMARSDLAMDLPVGPASCESLGGVLGVVDGPRLLLPPVEGRSNLGLSVLPEGGLLTFVEPTPMGTLDVLALPLDVASGSGEPAPIWTVPHPLPDLAVGTQAGALLMACNSPPSWAFVDAEGRPVGAELISASTSGCLAPAVAPIASGAIVGWIDGCDGGACMRIVATAVDAIVSAPPDGYEAKQLAPRLVAAAAGETALLATIATEFLPGGDARTRVVAQLVDHEATPLFPTFRIDVSVSPDELFIDWPLGLAATADGGYLLAVGRWKGGLGRLRFDAQGTPREDLVELDLPGDASAQSPYDSVVAVARRPGGLLLLGDGSDPLPGLLATALDEAGDATASFFVTGVPSTWVWAEDGDRVLLAWNVDGVQLLALGCVR